MVSAGRAIRLHELLARPGVHVLLGRDAGWPGTPPPGTLVHIHRLTSVPGRSLIAVRPDGYIGLRSQVAEATQLNVWLARIGVSTGPVGLGRLPTSFPPASEQRSS